MFFILIPILLAVALAFWQLKNLKFQTKVLELYKAEVNEIQIPIHKLLLYPVRGIKGIEVKCLQMTSGGAKFDREWVLVRKVSNKYISLMTTPHFTRLRQKLIFQENEEAPSHLELSVVEGQCTSLEKRKI
jgi:hypothetical protein